MYITTSASNQYGAPQAKQPSSYSCGTVPGLCIGRAASNRRAGAESRPRHNCYSRSLLKAQQAIFATRVHILTPLSFMHFQDIQSTKRALSFRRCKLHATRQSEATELLLHLHGQAFHRLVTVDLAEGSSNCSLSSPSRQPLGVTIRACRIGVLARIVT